MTTPQPSPHRAQLDAAVTALGLQVNRDNVLQARNALLAEAERLDRALRRTWSDPRANVMVCGRDPVSPEAAAAFLDRIGGLLQHCQTYNRDLRAAASALDATVRSYGYTEDEIAASFRVDQ